VSARLKSAVRSHTRMACRAAVAAVKAHPLATIVAIVTLTLAILAAAGQQRRPLAANNGGSATRPARPHLATRTPPASSRSQPAPATAARRERARAPARARTGPRPLWPQAARSAARRFLSTYLPFTYAQIPASKIRAATPALHARIASDPPDVPSPIRRLHPHISTLAIIPARIVNAGSGWAATATITDGQQRYQLTIKLGHAHGRWLVTGILTP
jgi:hypothetical protein